MERKEKVLSLFNGQNAETLELLNPLIDQLIFLENQLDKLRKLPFIVVSVQNPEKQRATPAYKQYKDLSQTYINALKVINSALGIDSEEVESPLRIYMKERMKKLKDE